MTKSPFRELTVKLFVHLMPYHTHDIQAGINEHLNKLLMKYNEELEGVVISYYNVKPLQSNGAIIADYPHIHFYVTATLLLFCPRVGSKLVGQVEKVGVDHIGLLVYGIFNAAIPRDAMATTLECDGEQEYWYDINNPEEQIGVGSVLQFTVTRLETSQDILAIQGSLAKEDEDSVIESETARPSHSTFTVTEISTKSKNARTSSEIDHNDDDESENKADNDGDNDNDNESESRKETVASPKSKGHNKKKARLDVEAGDESSKVNKNKNENTPDKRKSSSSNTNSNGTSNKTGEKTPKKSTKSK